MKKCKYCGKELPDNTKFCVYCGAPCDQEQQAKEQAARQNISSPTINAYAQQNNLQDQTKSAETLSLVGMVIGIVAIVLALIPGLNILGFIGGIIGIILSAISISSMKKAAPTKKNGKGIAGLICSIAAIFYGLIVTFALCAGCFLI